MHCFDFLATPKKVDAPLIVLYGDEPFLKQRIRAELVKRLAPGAEEAARYFQSEEDAVQWRDVRDGLGTSSLFGAVSGANLVFVLNADKFVSTFRAELEEYAAKPNKRSVLILDVSSFPGNTRLFKAVESTGLVVQCSAPEKTRGKSKSIDEDKVVEWIVDHAKESHDLPIQEAACETILEIVGPNFGMIDQELAKLAVMAAPGTKITPQFVRESIAGWRGQTAWEMIDMAIAGAMPRALLLLDRLLQTGEHPIGILAQCSFTLRRLATAVRIVEIGEEKGKKANLREALREAGVNDWPAGNLEKSEKALRRLGRKRSRELFHQLLELDLSLKGSRSGDDRARFAMESLLFSLGAVTAPRG